MKRDIQKILVIKLSALGDFVLALAAMKHIRQVHAGAHITLLTTPPFEALAKACPYFDAVEIDGKPKGLKAWWDLRKRIKDARFDRVYDLQTSSASARIFHLLQPGAPEWSGIAFGCAIVAAGGAGIGRAGPGRGQGAGPYGLSQCNAVIGVQ